MPDPKELEMEEQINGMCKTLHIMPPPVLRLKMEVFMGGEKVSHYEDRARSWVRNYYNFMTGQSLGLSSGAFGTTFEAGQLTMRNTAGTIRALATSAGVSYTSNSTINVGYFTRAAAGITAHGIVIGTGTTAESFEHHALATLIANGTGAGQMSYAAMDAPTVTWGGVTKKFTAEVIRYINNNSGGSITVNEAGLAGNMVAGGFSSEFILLARDLVSPGVDVANTAQLKVTYSIESATYPV
jgi:hypothetical protein